MVCHRQSFLQLLGIMGFLRCCALLVPILAVLGPLIASAMFDGRVWDLLPGWRVADMPDLTGKVVIVTGPTVNGIGHESCVEMARRGAHVILAGRSEPKGWTAIRVLKERVPEKTGKAEFMVLDLSSLESVKRFVEEFNAKNLPLHILMNSAGVMANPYELTVDGFESQFGTNHLGHFLLTKLLLPKLEASAPSRVVTVSSAAAFVPEMLASYSFGFSDPKPAADFDRLGADYEATYSAFKAYGRSKLANVLFTRALARRLEGKKVFANVCHPGGIKTNLGRHVEKSAELTVGKMASTMLDSFSRMVFMTPSQGAVTQLYLATSPEVEAKDIRGKYFRPQAMQAAPPKFSTEELEEKLWTISEKLVAKYQ